VDTYEVVEGDTWDSIAEALETPASWIMLNNGLDPNGDPPPADPDAGTVLKIPADPPGHSIAPENNNSLELGPGGLDSVRIRLHDDTPSPMTNVRYAADYEGGSSEGVSDDGWLTLYFPSGVCATVDLRWGAPDEGAEHPYRTVLVTDCSAGSDEDQAIARLNNLGYDATNDLLSAVRSFQYQYGVVDEDGLNDDGSIPSATQGALDGIFGDDCDATQP
jgi:LysM domain